MSVLVLDIADFRAQFPAFSNTTTYPDVMIGMWFDMATNYISDEDTGVLNGSSRLLALYLMTAHLLAIQTAINNGQPLQAMQSVTEGSVSISLVPPPVRSMWKWWLASTPYGQQLSVLLSINPLVAFM